ncbi:MAG: zinc ribbon domain-containing protein [Chloroflexi bacterium]|nr:zinc ribbon domain-containing protein [Chloroflexota bacterium]
MPIYEYQCPQCGRQFELRRSYQEIDTPAPCPQCGGQGKRLLSAAATKIGGYLKPVVGILRAQEKA